MRHVAQVIPSLDRIGGAEQQVILLARALKQRGWRVSVVALSGSGGEAAPQLRSDGVDFTTLHIRHGIADPRGWLRFHRWLRRNSPDVLHAHLTHAAWMARGSRLAADIPVMVDTLHSSATGGLIKRLGYRFSSFLTDRVTIVSEAAAQKHLAAGTVHRDKLLILPNGVDPERWRPDEQARAAARRDLGVTDEFLWLAAGRLEPVKDYPTLLRAFSLLPQPSRLIIAGAGWQQAELIALAAVLGLTSRVRFLGFAHDLDRWMRAADAFVLSSLWEGLPMALIEASAAGLPAVATDVPGVRDVLGPAADPSRLAPRADPAALARAMAGLMQTTPRQRAAIGAQARHYAMDQFSFQKVLSRWENLYHALLEGSRSARMQPTPPAISGSRLPSEQNNRSE